VRLVLEHEHEYPSQWKAICSIAEKSDLHRETLRVWVRAMTGGEVDTRLVGFCDEIGTRIEVLDAFFVRQGRSHQ